MKNIIKFRNKKTPQLGTLVQKKKGGPTPVFLFLLAPGQGSFG